MAIDESRIQILDRTSVQHVSLSRWVNEPLPSCEELLTAHDVARLTRRPHWVLATLALLGCFPKQLRFHGRRIGWQRREVFHWLASGGSVDPPKPHCREASPRPVQQELELRRQRCRHRATARPRCSTLRRKHLDPLHGSKPTPSSRGRSKPAFPSRKRPTSRWTSDTP